MNTYHIQNNKEGQSLIWHSSNKDLTSYKVGNTDLFFLAELEPKTTSRHFRNFKGGNDWEKTGLYVKGSDKLNDVMKTVESLQDYKTELRNK